jgi:hypothetical protein
MQEPAISKFSNTAFVTKYCGPDSDHLSDFWVAGEGEAGLVADFCPFLPPNFSPSEDD